MTEEEASRPPSAGNADSEPDEPKRQENPFKTEKGKRMAKAVAEIILMRYFFPGAKKKAIWNLNK